MQADAKWTYYTRNYLIMNNLQRGAGVSGVSGLQGGATLKNFFAYFSASMS